jgi:hypothetical protein
MKTILAVLLSISVTANAFLTYMLHSKPPVQAVAASVQSPAAIQTDADYEKIKSLYQSTIDLVHIQRVIYAGILVEIKYRNIAQQTDAEEKIDCSHCPQDFQSAWTAYIQERQDNYQSAQNKGREVIGDELAAITLSALGAENIAGGMAEHGLENAIKPAETSHVALNHLKSLLLKYKNAVPD